LKFIAICAYFEYMPDTGFLSPDTCPLLPVSGGKMKSFLQNSTIKKIFREHFKTDDTPIIRTGLEKRVLLSTINQKLSTISGVKMLNPANFYRLQASQYEEICYFKILSPSQYYRDQEFYLKYNEQNELQINERYSLSTLVYHLEEIYTLRDKVIKEYQRLEKNCLKKENEKLKRQKIKDLKHKAIIAKINEIAREDKLQFYIKEYTTKVKLIIRLAKSEQMAIDIPYGKFQETLKNLRITIQTIRALRESGITFKIHHYPSYREPRWISYE
jgi:hypothetical protein